MCTLRWPQRLANKPVLSNFKPCLSKLLNLFSRSSFKPSWSFLLKTQYQGGGGQQPFLQEITKLLIAKKLVKICSIIYFISYLKWIIWKLLIFKQYWLSIFVPGSRIGFKLFYSAKMAKSHCEIYSCNFFSLFLFFDFSRIQIRGH